MKTSTAAMLFIAAGLAAGNAFAGEVIGNTYIGERFGFIEVNAADGKWGISDREKTAANDIAGMVVHFKLKEKVSGWAPDVHITGFKKVGDVVTADYVLNMMRESWKSQGFTLNPIETGRISGRKVYLFEMQATLQGMEMKGRNVLLEGEKALFLAAMVTSAQSYQNLLPLFEELIATAKY